jgi:uncharacterized protein with HEPN domain
MNRLIERHHAEILALARRHGVRKVRVFGSTLVQDAAVRNLQILAESSQRLHAETRALEPTVDWRAISGLRYILVHGYLGIDLTIVWETIERDLPDLRDRLTRLLERLSESGSN